MFQKIEFTRDLKPHETSFDSAVRFIKIPEKKVHSHSEPRRHMLNDGKNLNLSFHKLKETSTSVFKKLDMSSISTNENRVSIKFNPKIIPLKITRQKFVPNLDKIQTTTQKLNEFLHSQKLKNINLNNQNQKITKIIAKEKISIVNKNSNNNYEDLNHTFREFKEMNGSFNFKKYEHSAPKHQINYNPKSEPKIKIKLKRTQLRRMEGPKSPPKVFRSNKSREGNKRGRLPD